MVNKREAKIAQLRAELHQLEQKHLESRARKGLTARQKAEIRGLKRAKAKFTRRGRFSDYVGRELRKGKNFPQAVRSAKKLWDAI